MLTGLEGETELARHYFHDQDYKSPTGTGYGSQETPSGRTRSEISLLLPQSIRHQAPLIGMSGSRSGWHVMAASGEERWATRRLRHE